MAFGLRDIRLSRIVESPQHPISARSQSTREIHKIPARDHSIERDPVQPLAPPLPHFLITCFGSLFFCSKFLFTEDTMNTLVTGGAGFIGSHLVDRLVELGHQVTVIDDFSTGRDENLKHLTGQVTIVRQSICDDLTEVFATAKPDVVFHLAAIPRVQFSIHHPREAHEANVNGTVNLLEACRLNGVKRFVFSSSSSIYGDQPRLPLTEDMTPNPMSPYALHKLIGEQYCRMYQRLYGIEPILLRYFNVFGPRQNPNGDYASFIPKFVTMMMAGEAPTIFGDGEQTRDFTYVGDVVAANIAGATTANETCFGQPLNVGAGDQISVNNVVREIQKITGATVQPIFGPAVIEPRKTQADPTTTARLLDWKANVLFAEGLTKTLKYFQTAG